MSSRRKGTPQRSNTDLGARGSIELVGGLPASGVDDQVGVIADKGGNLYQQLDIYQPRKKRAPAINEQQQYFNLLIYALSLPGVLDSLAQDGALQMRDVAKLKQVSKELRDNVALQEKVASGHFRRLRGYPYLYRYDPVYDPNVGFPQPVAARNFNFVQALGFGNQAHSNPSFPQEWALSEIRRLTPDAIKDLVIKAADRGVGGAPFHSVASQFATAFLPLTDQAVQSDGRGPTIPGNQASTNNPQQFGRYEMPRDRRMLSQNRSHVNSNLFGDGILLFDRLGIPGVQQLNPAHPGKISRYQVAGPRGPQQGGVAGNPLDLT